MTQLITAVYEKGMFKPLKEVNLKEHAEVKLIIKQENSAKYAFRKKIGELKNRLHYRSRYFLS